MRGLNPERPASSLLKSALRPYSQFTPAQCGRKGQFCPQSMWAAVPAFISVYALLEQNCRALLVFISPGRLFPLDIYFSQFWMLESWDQDDWRHHWVLARFLSELNTADLARASSRSRGKEAHGVIYKDTHYVQEDSLSVFNHVPKPLAPRAVTLG